MIATIGGKGWRETGPIALDGKLEVGFRIGYLSRVNDQGYSTTFIEVPLDQPDAIRSEIIFFDGVEFRENEDGSIDTVKVDPDTGDEESFQMGETKRRALLKELHYSYLRIPVG